MVETVSYQFQPVISTFLALGRKVGRISAIKILYKQQYLFNSLINIIIKNIYYFPTEYLLSLEPQGFKVVGTF